MKQCSFNIAGNIASYKTLEKWLSKTFLPFFQEAFQTYVYMQTIIKKGECTYLLR